MPEQYLGVDVGGTSVKLGICTGDGDVRGRAAIATEPERGAEDAIGRIGATARSLVDSFGRVRTLGIGIPGEIDRARGTLARANHFPGWHDVPVARCLGEQLGVPAAIENDANCAAWGEYRVGAGRGARSLACVTLGTGVGGGLVIDGALWTGANGAAGAMGHVTIDRDGPLCRCGQRGCVEQYASAAAVARRFGRGSARDAFEAAARGDAAAIAAVDEACDALAAALANVIHVVQPEVVVLAGGMAAAGDALLERVRAGVARRVRPSWLAAVRIERSALGGDAGWIGAALRAAT